MSWVQPKSENTTMSKSGRYFGGHLDRLLPLLREETERSGASTLPMWDSCDDYILVQLSLSQTDVHAFLWSILFVIAQFHAPYSMYAAHLSSSHSTVCPEDHSSSQHCTSELSVLCGPSAQWLVAPIDEITPEAPSNVQRLKDWFPSTEMSREARLPLCWGS